MTTLTTTSLGELAASANREHLACEAAYGSAIEHAFCAGEHLIAAKAEVAHGAWLPWVKENFAGSYRTAAAYMQVAGDPKLQSAATFDSLASALKTVAVPRESDDPEPVDAEVVDAEPEAEAPRSVVDMLRESGDLDEVERELEEEEARLAQDRFPRSGVERATLRQIRDALAGAQRSFDHSLSRDISDWTRAEALTRAARSYREAAESAEGLATMLRSAL
jgi:hypothetical protein